MNARLWILSTLNTLVFLDIVWGFDNDEGTNETVVKPMEDYSQRLHCLQCLAVYTSKRFDVTDPCVNPMFNVTESKLRYLTVCPVESKFCQVETNTLNHVFIAIERRCATYCHPICFHRGYGLETKTCSYCCDGINVDHWNEDTAYDHRCPISWKSGCRFQVTGLSLFSILLSICIGLII